MFVESLPLRNLGQLTLSRLVHVSDLRRDKYKFDWEVTGKFGESVMLDGVQIIVPRGFRKITYKRSDNFEM